VLKEKHVKLSLRQQGSDRLLDAIAFNIDRDSWSSGAQHVRLAYRLDINEFRGARTLQLRVEYLELLD